MSLNSYNPSSRYRQRSIQKMTGMISMVLVIILSASVGFWMGKQYAAEYEISLREQVRRVTEERETLQQNVTELRAEAQTANTRYEQLLADYNTQIPEGPMQDLTRLLREQVEQGMDPDRLAFAIKSARPPTDCSEPETRRFIVITPTYSGPDSAVSVADGAIMINGRGVSAQNKDGRPEAWFDPAQPVEISFIAGGETEVKKGTFPMRHSIIANGREYRFTVEEGAKSFAKIVFDSCAYP